MCELEELEVFAHHNYLIMVIRNRRFGGNWEKLQDFTLRGWPQDKNHVLLWLSNWKKVLSFDV